jgi:hypothetical protein
MQQAAVGKSFMGCRQRLLLTTHASLDMIHPQEQSYLQKYPGRAPQEWGSKVQKYTPPGSSETAEVSLYEVVSGTAAWLACAQAPKEQLLVLAPKASSRVLLGLVCVATLCWPAGCRMFCTVTWARVAGAGPCWSTITSTSQLLYSAFSSIFNSLCSAGLHLLTIVHMPVEWFAGDWPPQHILAARGPRSQQQHGPGTAACLTAAGSRRDVGAAHTPAAASAAVAPAALLAAIATAIAARPANSAEPQRFGGGGQARERHWLCSRRGRQGEGLSKR